VAISPGAGAGNGQGGEITEEGPMKLNLNDRVRVNVTGMVIDSHLSRIGVVKGFSRTRNCVNVLWDGRKSNEGWHENYLERVQK